MKLTFNYINTADIQSVSRYEIIKHHLLLPDEITHLIGVEKRIYLIGEIVSRLTTASLRMECKELGITNYLLNNNSIDKEQAWVKTVLMSQFTTPLVFTSLQRHARRIVFKVLSPRQPDVPDEIIRKRRPPSKGRKKRPASLEYNLTHGDKWCKTDFHREYYQTIQELSLQIELLLNAAPNLEYRYMGFHPFWYDEQHIKQMTKQRKKWQDELNKSKKPKGKSTNPKHGQGNRYGAIPGEFMGVQMRSQLEIRFAAEVEERDIEWIYEPERLGKGNYLVDFHLPQQKAWVEVKGTLNARDRFLLVEVADLLKNERDEKLYVYTSGKPMIIENGKFAKIERDEFWQQIEGN